MWLGKDGLMKLVKWFKDNCNKNKCTCWFDRYKEWDWTRCCQIHDIAYQNNSVHNKTKWQVDKDLFNCVRKETCWLFAAIMWLGNKTFSWKAWKLYKKDKGI